MQVRTRSNKQKSSHHSHFSVKFDDLNRPACDTFGDVLRIGIAKLQLQMSGDHKV